MVLTALLTAALCFGVFNWGKKLLPKVRLKLVPLTNAVESVITLEAAPCTVHWIGGETQTNYITPRSLPRPTFIQLGYREDGQLVWRPANTSPQVMK